MNIYRGHCIELDTVRRDESLGQLKLISHGRGKVVDEQKLVIPIITITSLWTMGVRITKICNSHLLQASHWSNHFLLITCFHSCSV